MACPAGIPKWSALTLSQVPGIGAAQHLRVGHLTLTEGILPF